MATVRFVGKATTLISHSAGLGGRLLSCVIPPIIPLLCILLVSLQSSIAQGGNSQPFGSITLDSAAGIVAGWAIDPAAGMSSISVDIYVDGSALPPYTGFVARVPTHDEWVSVDVAYPHFAGKHGFSYQLPRKYFDGRTHTLYVYGIHALSGFG